MRDSEAVLWLAIKINRGVVGEVVRKNISGSGSFKTSGNGFNWGLSELLVEYFFR